MKSPRSKQTPKIFFFASFLSQKKAERINNISMYCVKCGVELADSEKSCPLCGTEVICPNETRKTVPSPYPPYAGEVTEGLSRIGIMFILSTVFFIPFLLCLVCDFKINGRLIWSGYASGAILLSYVIAIFPNWFKKPNPVIFVPIDFAAIGLFLLYVNLETGGNWYLSFALPFIGALGLLTTAVVVLKKYTRGGTLFIYGGAAILLGIISVLAEFLMYITFSIKKMFVWSLYPFSAFFLIGMLLIVIGICKPIKEALKRRLFF